MSETQYKINQHTKKHEHFNNIQGKRKSTHAKHIDWYVGMIGHRFKTTYYNQLSWNKGKNSCNKWETWTF